MDETLLEGASDELRNAIAELTTQKEQLASWKQEQEVKELVKSKGLPEKAGALYLKSGLEFDKFVEEYGELFNLPSGNGDTDPAVKAGFNRIENTLNGAITPNQDTQLQGLVDAAKQGTNAIAAYMKRIGR